MPIIKTGRKSYDIKLSEATKKILREEQEQLLKNENIIFEREFHSDWIERSCSRCFMTQMKKDGEIFTCPKCGLVKVPKGIILKIDQHYQMRSFLQHKIEIHQKIVDNEKNPRLKIIYLDRIKLLQEELSKYT